MTSAALTEQQVRDEIQRLLGPEVLGYWDSPEGVAHHVSDKNSSHLYSVSMGMLMSLIEDAEDRGMSPAYILYYLTLRVWGQTDDAEREKIERFWNFNGGKSLRLEEPE